MVETAEVEEPVPEEVELVEVELVERVEIEKLPLDANTVLMSLTLTASRV